MKLNDIARAFGMTIDQFAKCIGYSRQNLYSGIRMTTRAKAAISNLHNLNGIMFRIEQEEAQRRYEARENAVKEFEQLILKGGECR